MVAEVLGGISAFKAMFDMAKSLKDINDATVRDRAVIELQKEILGAQVAQAALVERVSYLEKEMTRFETWDAEKQRYELKQVAPGAFAYSVKPGARGAEPAHWICAACYQNRKKFVLQEMPMRVPQAGGLVSLWACPACSAKISIPRGGAGPG
jgi:hypothetical protein